MIVDAHQHFWQLDLPFDFAWLREPRHAPICRSYLPADLLPQLESAGVTHSVFVQTQHNLDENRWALQLAREFPQIVGVVGWVDLTSEQCAEQLQEFRADPRFVGVRHITQGEPDPDFIIRPDVLRGLKILQQQRVPFDLLFYVQHLRHAAVVARLLPELPLVIDHLSKPQIREHRLADWKRDLQQAAACPNVYCKLSGLVTEADWQAWTVDDLRPYVETALEAFGPQRLMYGSDWPVCELAASYQQVYDAARDLVRQLTPTEQDRIFGGTACEFYGLQPGSPRSPERSHRDGR